MMMMNSDVCMVECSDVKRRLDRLMTTDANARKQMKAIIRNALTGARRDVTTAARASMDSDPRHAYRAVRSNVWKRSLGGSVTILPRRSGTTKSMVYRAKRKLREGQRGGNRRARSPKTERMDSYSGASRAFVLNFINSGTRERSTIYGGRGMITARNWFSGAGRKAIQAACARLSDDIGKAIKVLWDV